MSIVRAAEVVVLLFAVYIACGLAFAPFFVWRGVGRVDPAAKTTGLGFRLIILPGVAALWPLLLLRWRSGRQPPAERNAHRDAHRDEERSAHRDAERKAHHDEEPSPERGLRRAASAGAATRAST